MFQKLEKQINITFHNQQLLKNVFVHRSYLNEHRSFSLPSNEKLEFLGDSVLSLTTSIYLYKEYPQLHEGDYTDIKAAIVRTESLGEAAKKLDLGSHLLLSKGEEASGGRSKITLLADCMEALIAAIFIDQGFEKAYMFIADHLFGNTLKEIIESKSYLSPKSHLQQWTQARYKQLPKYKLVSEKGPEHDKTFTIEVRVKDQSIAQASGDSKKKAEEKAAANALEKLKG
ncbi:ribonuclease III [Candidatus Woesebacteria bacterium]|nr:ribonuclease III [Candidatus Woesebacteria bacterium]